jgi:hypothetical protein
MYFAKLLLIIKYLNVFTKITILCNIHGEFYMESRHLLNGHGCKKCSGCEKLTIDKIGHLLTLQKLKTTF